MTTKLWSNMLSRYVFSFVSFVIILDKTFVEARKHHLQVSTEGRPYVALSSFGFYINGHLDVKLSRLIIENERPDDVYGLSLDKTTIDQMNPYLDTHQNKCLLQESMFSLQRNGPILFLLLDLKNLRVKISCSSEWKNIHIYEDRNQFPIRRRKRHYYPPRPSNSTLFIQRMRRSDAVTSDEVYENIDAQFKPTDSIKTSLPLVPEVKQKQIDLVPKIKGTKSQSINAALQIPPVPIIKDSSIAKHDPIGINPDNENAKHNFIVKKHDNEKYPEDQLNPSHQSKEKEKQIFDFNKMQNIDGFCNNFSLPLIKAVENGINVYRMKFAMLISNLEDEGLYNLYFHACPNYGRPKEVSFTVDIEEKNYDNFLSAGEMPLPPLYFMMSLLFFLSGLFWVFILKKSKHTVYTIHYIMAVLVFLKSLSLIFHSINYHYIEERGEHVEAWAILYYIAHLLKGAVLFITIVLIGTGWTFVKHILSDKDKKIFMIVIPLQVLANVAEIIIDESEESDIEFRMWRNIFIFVDLLCCGAILFPIVWSIRHLHEASVTDGKAAINLRKLKLFRQFYIMIVCYIYFTRIIVYLLKMTEAFQYAWLHEMFREMATYVFFVLTGYKFRPTSSDLYFALANDDVDDDEVEVLTESGLTHGIHRTKAHNRNGPPPRTTIIENHEEERENLITKRESSHEYD